MNTIARKATTAAVTVLAIAALSFGAAAPANAATHKHHKATATLVCIDLPRRGAAPVDPSSNWLPTPLCWFVR